MKNNLNGRQPQRKTTSVQDGESVKSYFLEENLAILARQGYEVALLSVSQQASQPPAIRLL